MSCFSFIPARTSARREGGALVTNNAEFAKRAFVARTWLDCAGIYHDEVGFNYRMEGIRRGARREVAAPARMDRRAPTRGQALCRIAQRHAAAIAEAGKLGRERLASLRRAASEARRTQEASRRKWVGCALHYPLPLHLQKCYAHLGYKEGAFPVSEKTARECLSLPIYPELTDAQVQRVADVVKDFFKKS